MIAHIVTGYFRLTQIAVVFLLRLDWWLLHRWWVLMAGISYDLVRFGAVPQVQRWRWQRKLMRSSW